MLNLICDLPRALSSAAAEYDNVGGGGGGGGIERAAGNEDSTSRTLAYLKHSLVQQPAPEHSDALRADVSVVPSR